MCRYNPRHTIVLHMCKYATPLGVYKSGVLVFSGWLWCMDMYGILTRRMSNSMQTCVAALPDPMGCLPPVTPSVDRAKEGGRWYVYLVIVIVFDIMNRLHT